MIRSIFLTTAGKMHWYKQSNIIYHLWAALPTTLYDHLLIRSGTYVLLLGASFFPRFTPIFLNLKWYIYHVVHIREETSGSLDPWRLPLACFVLPHTLYWSKVHILLLFLLEGSFGVSDSCLQCTLSTSLVLVIYDPIAGVLAALPTHASTSQS
jgi:hypothetical protein